MKIERNLIKIATDINRLSPEMGGVFSSSDLSNLIGGGSNLLNSRVKQRLVRNEIVTRVQRGIYVTKKCDFWVLASRLSPNSYISLDSVLSKNGLIGSIPKRFVSAVHPARNRKVTFSGGTVQFHSIREDLIFGTEKLANGVAVADSEKAFIDLLYYYSKGTRFVVDPLSEVDVTKLTPRKIQNYLKKYRNPKFIKFVKGIINER